MSNEVNEYAQPKRTAQQILLMYQGFGADIVKEIQENEDLMNFLRAFPTVSIGFKAEDNSQEIAATASDVAKFVGVNGSSLTQKAKNAGMSESLWTRNKTYNAAALLYAARHMGKVSKGKTSFINAAIEEWLKTTQEDVDAMIATLQEFGEPVEAVDLVAGFDSAEEAGLKAYNDYKAAKAAKEAEEGKEE